ncbi:MAG: hypothetical protein DRH33_04540 [Candidatus Nealsonbacteria bacterium]|nr:MAG: hypothetical protein DRH33_04540 [Candidatus Nealsonbacteria bacterium]
MKILLQLILNGIAIGSMYGIMAIGLTLIWGVLKIINFAQGIFLVYSLFASYFLYTLWGINPFLGIFIIFPVFFLLGIGVYKLLVQKVVGAPFFVQAFMTNGIELVMRSSAFMLFGVNYRSISPSYVYNNLDIFGLRINVCYFIAIIVNIGAVLILSLFLNKTYTGKAIRALSQQRIGSMLVGINVNKLLTIAFGLGIAYTSIAGVVMSNVYSIFPGLGQTILLVVFVVFILGGEDVMGAFYAGLVIGIIEVFTGYFIDIALKEVVYLIVFLVILLFKPTGIVGLEEGI